jgi:hypothetical protein
MESSAPGASRPAQQPLRPAGRATDGGSVFDGSQRACGAQAALNPKNGPEFEDFVLFFVNSASCVDACWMFIIFGYADQKENL